MNETQELVKELTEMAEMAGIEITPNAQKIAWFVRSKINQEQAAEIDRRKAEVDRLTKERDDAVRTVGEIAATVPLPDIIRATGSVKDMIDYFKQQAQEIARLRAGLTRVRARLNDDHYDEAVSLCTELLQTKNPDTERR